MKLVCSRSNFTQQISRS